MLWQNVCWKLWVCKQVKSILKTELVGRLAARRQMDCEMAAGRSETGWKEQLLYETAAAEDKLRAEDSCPTAGVQLQYGNL